MKEIFRKVSIIVITIIMCLCIISAHGAEAKTTAITLETFNGLNVASDSKINKVFIVSSALTKSTACTVQYFKRTSNGWKIEWTTNGVLGRNGINKKKEGDGKTPTGKYHFTKLFGNYSDPRSSTQKKDSGFSYTKLKSGMYWCGSCKKYYNTFQTSSKHKKYCSRKNDEALWKIGSSYNYAAAISYNSSCKWYRGSAIFFHVRSSSRKHSTAGCVAIYQKYMKKAIQAIDKHTVIIIDTKSSYFTGKY